MENKRKAFNIKKLLTNIILRRNIIFNIINASMERKISKFDYRELALVRANIELICNIHSRADLLNELCSSRQIRRPIVIRDRIVRSEVMTFCHN